MVKSVALRDNPSNLNCEQKTPKVKVYHLLPSSHGNVPLSKINAYEEANSYVGVCWPYTVTRES